MSNEASNDLLTHETFAQIAGIAKSESGLQLGDEKRMMVQARLKKRLRETKIDSFSSYGAFVQSDAGRAERRMMISALTTNVTNFFRESHHFDVLTTELGETLKRKIVRGDRIRIWSAGCSKGHEPYSIAIHLLDNFPDLAAADFRILATDIDPQVLAVAKAGHYSLSDVRSIPDTLSRKYMQHDPKTALYSISSSISKSLII